MSRFVLILMAFLIFSGVADAADGLRVRGSLRDGFSRLVFEGQGASDYRLEEAGSSVSIHFNQASGLDASGFDAQAVPAVISVDQVSSGGQAMDVKIEIVPGATIRYFAVGSKLIVDVYPPPGYQPPKDKKQPAPEKKPVPLVKPPEKSKKDEAPKISKKTDAPEKPAAKKDDAASEKDVKTLINKLAASSPQIVVDKQPLEDPESKLPRLKPHLVTLAMLETTGMAVFIKNGRLWIVLDRPDINLFPTIVGPTPDAFSKFKRYDLQGGTAFVTTLPSGYRALTAKGEGSGMAWRIVVASEDKSVEADTMEKAAGDEGAARGGKVFWPMSEKTAMLDVADPLTGDVLKVVTVGSSSQYVGKGKEFVDFTLLPSYVGLAVRTKVDDLEMALRSDGVEISRPGGLALSHEKDINRHIMRSESAKTISLAQQPVDPTQRIRRVFDFDRWTMGGMEVLEENQRILLGEAGEKKDVERRVQTLLTVAKMDLANDRGQEAIGLLQLAAEEFPVIQESPEFLALRGAAYALSSKYELALGDFVSPALSDYSELDYWRSLSLAWLGDWQQARESMPKDYSVLVGYPLRLLEKIGLKLAEVALRNADVNTANAILQVLENNRSTLRPATVAGIDYLKGEAHRQKKEYEAARKLWEPLLKGADDWYRARAGLALSILDLQLDPSKRDKVIDRLEGLRYAWRGDELEAQINFTLGRMYIENRNFVKGFGILRDAVGISPDTDIARDIDAYVRGRFKDALLNDKNISPLDAITVYEEFTEFMPPGEEGDAIVQKVAERVIDADLLERAAGLLQSQIDTHLQGAEKGRVASRLAAVHLLDHDGEKAMQAIGTARSAYAQDKSEEAARQLHNLELMNAKALAEMNKKEEALALLSAMQPAPDVNSLRADIAWHAGLWEDAAEALDDMILDHALDLSRPLTVPQAELILNRAVALNLSGNRVALVNIRKRYMDAMKKTSKSSLFDVVTRPRNSTVLADRETLQSLVSEVDIFKGFLESYRKGENPAPAQKTAAPAAPAAQPAAQNPAKK